MPPYSDNWALFLDIDGTLLRIADTPDAVTVHPRTTRLLKEIIAALDGAVALISGRTIAGIDRLFAPLRLPAAGQHGVERRDAAGRIHRASVDAARLRHAVGPVREFAQKHRGLVFEDKGYSVALHYRRAPAMKDAAHDVVLSAASRLEGAFEAQHGKMVIELKPTGADKGTAIEDFMKEPPFAGRVPVFIGDDVTDEQGFRAVNALGGHSIKVGEGATCAQWRLRDAAAVLAWLRQWPATQAPSGQARGPSRAA